ncbi:MAG: alcohol dehydrogenase catalytic domain-containing protein [Phycisphaerales bacterium JB065]
MRALRYTGASGDGGSSVRLFSDAPVPKPAPGEALIRPLRVGVCSTDLEIARGYMDEDRGGEPITLGHEFVGVVEEFNAVTPVQQELAKRLKGQRVVGSINAVCGECDLCRAGLSNHCRARTVLGIAGRDGCFAERFCLPIVNLVAVPDSVDDDRAVFAEPLAAALHAAHQLHFEGKPYITVLGDGRLGLLCVQVMSRLNASVRLIGKHEKKVTMCEKWGIKHRMLRDIGRRADQDIVVDCTGSPDGLRTAMQLVRPRGTILMKSTFAPRADDPVDLSPLVVNEIELVGSRCGSMNEAVRVLEEQQVDVVSLITSRFAFEDGAKAMDAAARSDQIKVLMDL